MPIQHCAAQDSIFRRAETFLENGSSSPYHDHPRSCRDLNLQINMQTTRQASKGRERPNAYAPQPMPHMHSLT